VCVCVCDCVPPCDCVPAQQYGTSEEEGEVVSDSDSDTGGSSGGSYFVAGTDGDSDGSSAQSDDDDEDEDSDAGSSSDSGAEAGAGAGAGAGMTPSEGLGAWVDDEGPGDAPPTAARNQVRVPPPPSSSSGTPFAHQQFSQSLAFVLVEDALPDCVCCACCVGLGSDTRAVFWCARHHSDMLQLPQNGALCGFMPV
jgi:hypothetical protein